MDLTEHAAYAALVEHFARIYAVLEVVAEEVSDEARDAQPIAGFFRPMMSRAEERRADDLEMRAGDIRQSCAAVLAEAEAAGVDSRDVMRMAWVVRSEGLVVADGARAEKARQG